MQTFWPTIEAINQFTQELDAHADSPECPHCRQTGQFVSHGFVYQKRQCGDGVAVGKRVVCSGRYGRSGCCRTQRLYLTTSVPRLHYLTTSLTTFLVSLFACHSIADAYRHATGTADARHAYRWLGKVEQHLTLYRGLVHSRPPALTDTGPSRSRYRQIVLPTLRTLMNAFNDCATFQARQQTPFI